MRLERGAKILDFFVIHSTPAIDSNVACETLALEKCSYWGFLDQYAKCHLACNRLYCDFEIYQTKSDEKVLTVKEHLTQG